MSMESLLNLDTLTEEERKIILSVLRKDDELKKTQDRKIGQLKLEIQAIRMKSVLRNGDDLTKMCARCHAELGFLFNRGDLCPKCHFKVCRACQEVVLDGTWLCILCHKQRQLKFFMEEWNRGKPTKQTGTELVKASMIKQRRPGRVNDEHTQPDKTRGVQNGNPVHNGSAFRSKKEAESERIEYPNDSDRRKLTQLFDTFKLNKSNEKPEQTESKTQVSVKKLSTRRFDDSDEDSSSSDEDRPSRDILSNVPQRIKDTHSAENVSLVEHVSRGVLQRNYSDDSDQTAMSDETPFLKNTGSTETQIRVEIHSDSSGTPQKIKPPISDQNSDKIKHDGVVRAESMSSYRSTSPELIDTPSLQRQAYSHNRSPSPYSFDSIPSSHADSPLPKQKFSELHRKDSDADSRISGISGYSGVSGAAEHSGTESAVKDSGEEYVVEEVTNIKFRRISRKHKGSSDNSPVDDVEAYQWGNSGKGRVDYVDIPKDKALIKVSEISVSDIERDIYSEDEGYVNLELMSMPTSQTHGKGLIGAGGRSQITDSPHQSKKYNVESKSTKTTQNQKSKIESKTKKETLDHVDVVNVQAKTRNNSNKNVLIDNKTGRLSPDNAGRRQSSKSKMKLVQKETEQSATSQEKELLSQLIAENSSVKSVIPTNKNLTTVTKSLDAHPVEPKSDSKTRHEVPKLSNNANPKHEKLQSKESKTSPVVSKESQYDESFEDIVSNVQRLSCKSDEGIRYEPGKNKLPSEHQDSEFDEVFNIAMADLSVEESTDMSDTGSISRAKGKKLKHMRRKKKSEKKDEHDTVKQTSPGDKEKGVEVKHAHIEQNKDTEVIEKRKYHLQNTEVISVMVTEEDISPVRVVKEDVVTEEEISPIRLIKEEVVTEKEISPIRVIKEEVVTEEEISPVRIIKDDVTLFSVDKLEKMATSSKPDLNKSETRKIDNTSYNNQQSLKEGKDASENKDEHFTKGKTAQFIDENVHKPNPEIESHSEQREDIKLESLSLQEIMELMRNNVLPMDEELLRLIEEQFAQNRDIVLPSLITTGGSDSDELSIIHEESEPSESDTSLENNMNKSLQDSKPVMTSNIPEVKVEDYEQILSTSPTQLSPKENYITKMKVTDITSFQDEASSKEVENVEIHNTFDVEISEISADLSDEFEIKDREHNSSSNHINNPQSSTQELEKFYKEIKQKVAFEYYMETQNSKKNSSPVNDGVLDNTNENLLTDKLDTKETKLARLSDASCLRQPLSDDALSNVKAQLFPENHPETDIYNLSNESLESKDIENSQTIELHEENIPDIDIYYEKDISSTTSVDKFTEAPSDSEQSQVSPRSVVISQFTRSSSVTLEVDESDSESYIAITSNESGSPVKIVSELNIEVPSSPVHEKERVTLNDTEERSDSAKTPSRKVGYQKFVTPFPEGHTPTRADNLADITLTPTEKSIDSEGTFCASLEDGASDIEVKDIINRKSKAYEKSDIVGQSLSREVLVKQWLSSKTELRDDNSSSQSDLSETASTNPALQPESPACGLSSQEIPKLNMQDWKESEGEITTKLSPRASSEGSASFEDSGHVSGASTQENTPEHRRTDSLQSQTSMGSSKLSTVTDKESEESDIDEIVKSHRSLQGSMGSSRNLLSAMAESKESLVSFYSNAGDIDYGKIPVTGDMQFGLDYNYRTGTLEIHICQCKGLAPADTKRNRSDPYVKTYLLPDKTRSGKRKTKIKKHTLNPIFDEKLRYLISKSELENRTVWVTVWHNDRFGRNDFLGEVTINFDYFRFGDSAAKWYKLQERFEQPTSLLTYKGDVILCLKYVPPEKVNRDSPSPSPSPTRKKIKKPRMPGDKGQLHVMIREARNLTAVRSNGYSDPFCKGQLLPDKEKQKTPVIKKECNPAWNYTMVFDDVTVDSLKEKSLELTIWDYDKLSSNDFLGGVRLNLGIGKSFGKIVDWMDARGEEISLWQAMLDRPNFWIDGALVLRSTMNKRK